MPTRETDYASYMLRLRRVKTGETSRWIPSLESTATGERRSFPTLDALYEFIESEFDQADIHPNAESPAAENSTAGKRYYVLSDKEIAV